MLGLFSLAPRASTLALTAICMMSGVLAQDEPTQPVTEAPEDTGVVTEAPEDTGAVTEAPEQTDVVLPPGRYISSTVVSENNIVAGDFSAFFPDKVGALTSALEADFVRGLNARSRDRQAQTGVPPQWDVVVKNVRSINNNTELAFDVEAVQTRFAPTDDVVPAAPAEALEDFRGFYDFAAVTGNKPLASTDELYTATTGQTRSDAFISRAVISPTVTTNVFTVTSAPAVSRDQIDPASIAVPAVLGGLLVCCLIGACVAFVLKKRGAAGTGQLAESVVNDPYEVKVEKVENQVGAAPAVYSPTGEW